MGKHYVPQAHLRRFEIDGEPGFIWMFDKKTSKYIKASISKVAQEADFYSEEVEKALAQVIEHPGNSSVAKLLQQEELDNQQRTQLSLYMMIMMTRGPGHRKKSMERAKGVVTEVLGEARTQIEEWAVEKGEDWNIAKDRLEELGAAEAKFLAEVPENILEQIREPFWSETTVECIHNMCWHIVPSPDSTYYVTSDGPAHYFESLGLGTEESEFTISLSKNVGLVGEQKRNWGTRYERPQGQLVKEINRRIISQADRFVFSPRADSWIQTVAEKAAPRLSRIEWIRK